MSRRAAALIAGAAVALAALAVAWWLLAGREQTPRVARDVPLREVEPGEIAAGELLFPDSNGQLSPERRELPTTGSPTERTAAVVTALLAGPNEPGLFAPLADGVALGGVHLSRDGIVYVDLGAPELAAPPVAGSRSEILTVYSFVNSILANVPEARGVVLLWNGQQRPTFAGHIDTSRPLTSERRWQAR